MFDGFLTRVTDLVDVVASARHYRDVSSAVDEDGDPPARM